MSEMAYFRQYLRDNKATLGQHGDHEVGWIPQTIFNELPIERWNGNRPEDEGRVGEIAAHLEKQTHKRVDGIIYLAYLSKSKRLVCYEGNHRRMAVKRVDGVNLILVDILWDTTDELVAQEFIRLNLAQPVPDIYVDGTSDREEIQRVVDDFCITYKKARVNTNKPQRPNFNRDGLTSELTRIIREVNIPLAEVIRRLEIINRDLIINGDRTQLTPKIIAKCQETGLWLFAWSSKLDTERIRRSG